MTVVHRTVRLVAPAALLLALGACRGPVSWAPGDAEPDYQAVRLRAIEAPEPAGPPETVVAKASLRRVPVFRQPRAGDAITWFERRGSFGEPRVFLVREMRDDWLRVLLPMKPNGSEGWIRARDVELSRHPYRIEVDLGRRRLTVLDAGDVVLREAVAVGTSAAPTPTGLFYTTVLAEPDDPSGPYGRFAYGLSAYSEVYEEFAGGDGQVAIHGTNAPWLIGQAVSHGCIRMRNDSITRLARFLPLGTPVRITR
jgi:hypothetical protein